MRSTRFGPLPGRRPPWGIQKVLFRLNAEHRRRNRRPWGGGGGGAKPDLRFFMLAPSRSTFRHGHARCPQMSRMFSSTRHGVYRE